MSNNLIPTSDEIKAIEIMAKNATDSKYFDKLGGPAGIFSICMYARELGIPVMSALFGGMQSILGKITISPQLMNSMIRRAGHKLEIDTNEERASIKGTRKDTGETCTATFSVEEAKKANLFKVGGGWDKYPSDMCFARAMSRLARRLFPDVIGSCYVEDEIPKENENESKKPNKVIDVESSETSIEEISPEQYEEKFYETFKDLNYETLKAFMASRPNALQTMKNVLSDKERFKRWFIEKIDKKPEVIESNSTLSEEIIDAMKSGKI